MMVPLYCFLRHIIILSIQQFEHCAKTNMTTTPIQFYRRVLPGTCTSFESQLGKSLFKEALANGHMECYFKLASQFRTQDEPAYCGLTTLVMVLNALEVDPGKLFK